MPNRRVNALRTDKNGIGFTGMGTMRANNSQADSNAVKSRRARARRGAGSAVLSVLLLAAAWDAAGDTEVLMSEDFESETVLNDWNLSGDWRFKTNSACLPNELAYRSPTKALVFDYGSECRYRNNRSGYAAMKYDVHIPITLPSVTLEWWDYAGAELGADFYFIQVSTDSGATWPYEVYRDSQDEAFWDMETVDLTPFIGQNIRLRFGFTSDDTITNVGWYIDDVRIAGEALDEGISAVALSDASIVEGDTGTQLMEFVLSIQPVNPAPITLEYATFSGTANAGLDFVSISGPMEIPAGAATASIGVQIIGDAFFEETETFTLEISNPSANARITIGQATGFIHDNEELTCTYNEDFEPRQGTFRWTTNYPPNPPDPAHVADLGLWHIQSDSGCLPGMNGYTSATHALVFSRELDCRYDTPGGVEGFVRMTSAEQIPDVDALTAQLRFRHHLEIAYSAIQPAPATAYVEISTNVGINWTTLKTFAPESPSPENYLIP